MLHLLPFVAGIATGALAIKLWRNQTTRAGLDKAQDKLRQVTGTAKEKLRKSTVSSLDAIEHSSAKMRAKLEKPAATAKPGVKELASPRKPAAAKKIKTVEAKPATEAAS